MAEIWSFIVLEGSLVPGCDKGSPIFQTFSGKSATDSSAPGSQVSSYSLQSRRRSKPRRLTKRHASQKEAIATAQELVRNLGGTFVEQLGIDLAEGSPQAIDKWFMWALLFNHRISANIVFKTHQVRIQRDERVVSG